MARRSALLALLLLAPSLAAAQATPGSGAITVVESADPTEVNPPYINIAECNGTTTDTLTYYWNVSTSFTSGGTYELWIADKPSSSTACPADTTSTVTVNRQAIVTGLSATSASQSHADTATVQTRLSQIKGTLSSFCDGTATEVYLCVNYTPSGGTKVINAASGTLKIDLGVPPTPSGVGVVPGDTALHVSWAAGSGGTGTATGYRVFWGLHNGDLSSSHELTGVGTLSYDIGGLQNGTEYDVQVVALTAGKNEGTRSDRASGVPVVVNDFWRQYKNAGGHEEGGCTSGAAGLAAILVMLPLALRRRRS